ncbi:MAG: hypothetical protein IJJ28_03380, partial [Lentisphaeria bacterium]|nr:hypothetical protein [Lentisphaeria bacterium]
ALAASLHIPEEQWEVIVDADPEFLRAGGKVCRREAFFTGRTFLITPETWEIDSGILVPGHRFVPCLDPEVFPSEVVLRSGRRRIRTREVSLPLAQVVGCFPLLGTEQMMDVLMAESPANGFLRSGARGDREVTLTVFDLADFYREHDFEEGDALRCEVVDYRGGTVKFSFLSGGERPAAGKRAFIAALDEACAAALRGAEDLEVPEILAQSLFRAGTKLDPAGASLDEFIRESLKIVLGSGSDGRGELRVADAEPEDEDGEVVLPEGLAISSGETGTLPAMLKATGTALTPEELDGFILDACATREMDFQSVFARAFRGGGPRFSDAAQEAVFMNTVEDRFEELTGHYDRVDDELKAPLRSSVIEAVEERLDFFAEAAALERSADSLTAEKLQRLAAVAGRLGTLLKLLNREDFMPDAHEVEHLEAQLENFLDEQDAALEALREDLSETNQPKGPVK